jgi:hypothetical protein
MRKGAAVLALVSLALFDCATLNPLGEGTCGNGVIDANEDCDGFAAAGVASSKCGAPSEGAAACRLQCATASDCPDGWGCAVTRVCREPSGRFGAIGEGVSAGVETMVVGDFDGDRRKDVLGSGPQGPTSTANVRVHYFGDDAQLAQVNSLAASISSPTVRDFNGDGIDDFGFGLDIGALGVITGQPDRSLVPAVFPSFRVPHVDAKPLLVRAVTRRLPSGTTVDVLFAGTLTSSSGVAGNLIASSGENGYRRELPVPGSGIIGEPLWGKFFTDPDSTCGEVAVAMKSGTNGVIQVFAPCRPKVGDPTGQASEWASLRAPIVIQPTAPLEGIRVVDEKSDGHADILFLQREARGPVVYLARGGSFGFDAPVETALVGLPLASADLDRDGTVDFVMPGGIILSNRAGTIPVDGGADAGTDDGLTPFRDYVPRFSDRRVTWTSARIGLFNGDDLLDVVAASSDLPDLDFFGAVTKGVFVQSTIPTSGPVSHIAIGDFDGDKLVDVGFVERRPGSAEAFDLAIAYARTNGPPEPARIVGRTEKVLALENVGDPEGQDANSGLALFFSKPSAEGGLPDLSFAVVIGNGDRQPVAPLLLDDGAAKKRETDPDIVREWVPLAVHSGNVADPNRVDLIAFAVGYRISRSRQEFASGPFPSAVWVSKGTGGTSFDAPEQVADLEGFSFGNAGISFEVRTAVADIDNPKDGRADVVVFQRNPAKDVVALYVARADARSGLLELPGERVRRDAPLSLVDVDADGNLDAVILLGDGDARKVAVFYNDAKGGFVSSPAIVPIPEGDVPRGFAHFTTVGASIDGARKAKRELAVVTTKRIVLAAPDAADRSKLVVRDIVPAGGAPLSGPTGLAQGDFDGDGVDDLAIADSGALRILRQLPVRP